MDIFTDFVSAARANILDPSDTVQDQALIAVFETMAPSYQRLVGEYAELIEDFPDRIEPRRHQMLERVSELCWFHVYRCPKPIALPLECCRAFMELEPGRILKFGIYECANCAFDHPFESWYESNGQVLETYPTGSLQGLQERRRILFDKCVLCGDKVAGDAYAQRHRRIAPCHHSSDSAYSRAMRAESARLRLLNEQEQRRLNAKEGKLI
jgi:hypothetical protein